MNINVVEKVLRNKMEKINFLPRHEAYFPAKTERNLGKVRTGTTCHERKEILKFLYLVTSHYIFIKKKLTEIKETTSKIH